MKIKHLIAISCIAFISACAANSSDSDLPRVAAVRAEDVVGCKYLENVDASRRSMASANNDVKIKAARIGATHVVFDPAAGYLPTQMLDANGNNINIVMPRATPRRAGQYAIAKAYNCKGRESVKEITKGENQVTSADIAGAVQETTQE